MKNLVLALTLLTTGTASAHPGHLPGSSVAHHAASATDFTFYAAIVLTLTAVSVLARAVVVRLARD